jgi:lipopolysaccharide/colanic/teichoic acid biosynthesis glycosyltransferase
MSAPSPWSLPWGHLVAKRAVDVVVASLLLLLMLPVLLFISVAVKVTSEGPVFFRQARVGRGASVFRIWKFRSMSVDADERLDAGGVPSGGRLTPVGPFLRRWGLDELPQLVNVVRGDMSLIGPRPLLPDRLRFLTPEERHRFRMRPGITGLAQVAGRNTLPWSRRLLLDQEYVRRYSLLLDLNIAARTVRVLVSREGFKEDRNPQDVDDISNRD